jgi:hypothetical protein
MEGKKDRSATAHQRFKENNPQMAQMDTDERQDGTLGGRASSGTRKGVRRFRRFRPMEGKKDRTAAESRLSPLVFICVHLCHLWIVFRFLWPREPSPRPHSESA